MTYTIGSVWPRLFIEPGLGVLTYFDFCAIIFVMQWPPYGAHILQGLYSDLIDRPKYWVYHAPSESRSRDKIERSRCGIAENIW